MTIFSSLNFQNLLKNVMSHFLLWIGLKLLVYFVRISSFAEATIVFPIALINPWSSQLSWWHIQVIKNTPSQSATGEHGTLLKVHDHINSSLHYSDQGVVPPRLNKGTSQENVAIYRLVPINIFSVIWFECQNPLPIS